MNNNNPWAKIERLQHETAEMQEHHRAIAKWKPRLDAHREEIEWKHAIREGGHA